jgi:23S rRNA (cytidine1920-2'-O)/16S rRNA (cytidine1409-2'-O)-methyltransferase
LKLEGALDDLEIDVAGKTILDIGASTGGFTDVCLRRGASRVFAIDVGTNQLAYALRTDSRVLSLEKTNARYLTPDMLPGTADLALIDVSFISITKLLAPILDCLSGSGEILAMVKPQFEVGKDKVGKGGVVRDEATRKEAIGQVAAYATSIGLVIVKQADSHIKGPKGNQETFLHLAQI